MSDPTDLEIPGHVTLAQGEGGLPKVVVETAWSNAEIYLHGAHVTGFQKKGEPPLLFMSAASEFAPGKPIRGGIPVIFPWFGAREGSPAHGSARITAWELKETALLPNGAVELRKMYARREARGQGLGRRLLERALAYARGVQAKLEDEGDNFIAPKMVPPGKEAKTADESKDSSKDGKKK